MARTLRLTPPVAVVVVIVVLGLLNVVDIRVARASLIVGPVVVAGLTGIARLAGLSWQDLGLGPGTWRPGLRWAAVEIGIVGLVLAAAAALPLTREAFRDTRYRLDLGNTLLTSLVLIPIGTVLVEELAFRGVLWGAAQRGQGHHDGDHSLVGLVRRVACAAVTRAGHEQPGDHRRRRHGQIGADHDGAGDGAVHCPVRRGVL